MVRFRQQKTATSIRQISRSGGFSAFEIVVFIIMAAIIYAGAANRFAEFPGQAERANFQAIATQLQSAINLEMMYGTGVGRIARPTDLVGLNPMDLLLEPPSNYIGAFDAIDTSALERRVWYFDRASRELVYLVNATQGVALIINGTAVPADEIRFRIEAQFSPYDASTGLPARALENAGRTVPASAQYNGFDGVLMRPTLPYVWNEADQDTMVQQAIAQN